MNTYEFSTSDIAVKLQYIFAERISLYINCSLKKKSHLSREVFWGDRSVLLALPLVKNLHANVSQCQNVYMHWEKFSSGVNYVHQIKNLKQPPGPFNFFHILLTYLVVS